MRTCPGTKRLNQEVNAEYEKNSFEKKFKDENLRPSQNRSSRMIYFGLALKVAY